jgi:K+-sensing histidine kinase KdpD
MSAVPAFEPTDGRFAGYRGIALRDLPAAVAPDRPGPELPDPDSLRELVHEIKTPLNAIIGFAEIIDGQFLGPADRGYRERAADIVAQARLLLGAIDDLDFAAKVHSGDAGAASRRVDLAELFASATGSLKDLAEASGVQLELARLRQSAIASVEPELADRLLYRLASAVIDRAQAGERVRLSVDQSGDRWRVSITRPAALRGAGSTLLSDAASPSADKGDAAATLQLRLVRGLARVAGGDLAMTPSAFTLLLPAARGA